MEILIIAILITLLLLNVATFWVLVGISGFLMRMADSMQVPEKTPQQQNTIDLIQ